MLPHSTAEDEVHDPDFRDTSEVRSRAKKQAQIIRHFQSRWKSEYLTALRETYRVCSSSTQHVKVGNVVLIHDNTPRVNWWMVVIESVNKARDGVICSVNTHTTTGQTNRPIACLYPLELTADERSTDLQGDIQPEQSQTDVSARRPMLEAARRG